MRRFFLIIDKFVEGLVVFLMFLLIILGGTQVLSRYIFSYSITWANEILKYSLIWLVFLCTGIALQKNLHISMNTFVAKMPSRIKIVLKYFVFISEIVIGCAIVFYSIQLIKVASFQTTPALGIPIYIIYYGMVIGGVYIALIGIRSILENLKGEKEA